MLRIKNPLAFEQCHPFIRCETLRWYDIDAIESSRHSEWNAFYSPVPGNKCADNPQPRNLPTATSETKLVAMSSWVDQELKKKFKWWRLAWLNGGVRIASCAPGRLVLNYPDFLASNAECGVYPSAHSSVTVNDDDDVDNKDNEIKRNGMVVLGKFSGRFDTLGHSWWTWRKRQAFAMFPNKLQATNESIIDKWSMLNHS